jgi:hypothetical protein
MTKKEWLYLRKGVEVEHKTWKPVDGKPVDVTLTGTVVRMNSNHSQALVKWEGDDFESWYGRLGIEIKK